MANVSVVKAKPMAMPKATLPKPKQPKQVNINKVPKQSSMAGMRGASKAMTGLKGAISKGNLAQLNMANLNRSY